MFVQTGIWVTAVGLATLSPSPSLAGDCPATGETRATVTAVEARLELRLDDGRLVRLAGFDPASQTPDDPDLPETARETLAVQVAGRPMTFRFLSATPDRWGRLSALVFPASANPRAGGLAAVAIAAGLGRFLPEPAAHMCRDEFLSAEANARQAKLGLWADPYYAVLAVDDDAAFAERSGTVVVVEGRLTAVEPGPFRTKLRFAAPGSHGRRLLAATILPRVMKAFEARGVTINPLIGGTLRLRGLLDLRFGPQIELDGPDEVEIVAAPAK